MNYSYGLSLHNAFCHSVVKKNADKPVALKNTCNLLFSKLTTLFIPYLKSSLVPFLWK